MKNIWIGLLLIFLDFSLNLNNVHIGLIPDFIGYLVMLGGLAELTEESPLFDKVRPFAVGMAVYTGILYALDLFGVSASLGYLSALLGIISTAVSLYITYDIVMGVREMEETYHADLNGDRLYSAWKLQAIFSLVSFFSLLLPLLALVFILAAFCAAVYFLVMFNRAKNRYYELKL
jgi:uncharacterized protein involved in cysteine biosynthesis